MIIKDKPTIEEVHASVFGEEDDIYHYGMPRRSGRYPYGSGKDPYQHSGDFLSRVEELRKQKFTYTDDDGKTYTGDTAIAKSMGLTSTQFRTQIGLAKDEQRSLKVDTAKGLKEKGYSNTEIGRRMGINESSVRSLLNEKSEAKMQEAKKTADFLKQQIAEKGMIDIGTGVDKELNISKEKLKQAIAMLEMEGYEVHGGRVPQVTNPSQMTTIKALCPPGTPKSAIYDYDKVKPITEYTYSNSGEMFTKFTYPKSMDSNRLMIRYKEDGGIDQDGLVEIRRGVEDLSLGGSHYSQVRILVDNNRYIKGMAVYGEDKDFPPGVDVIFNTNKGKDVPKMEVLKEIKKDPTNPFGSAIKSPEKGGQYWYTDKNGKKQLGLINKRSDEGDWSDWADKLPSQFLSKQSISLAKKQLGIAAKDKQDEFDTIMSLTNPTVKKKLLEDFADGCDSAAVHLHAAALPRQKYNVIIPLPTIKDTEIYAPGYKNGEKVALVRYPHGGTFEIPVLTVNNKVALGKKRIGLDSMDAVGINSKVANQLSGADFDGDTVMVIPTNDKVKIKSSKPLEGLKEFDPKISYATKKEKNPNYTGKKGEEEYLYYNSTGQKVKIMSKNLTQTEMGKISNLITDMTLKGATPDELERAVKHSMVVIDANKHKLDYKQSFKDNNIAQLKNKYQEGGASTLISRAKSEKSVDKRQGSAKVNMKYDKDGKLNPDYDPNKPEGSLIYKTADDLYYPDRTSNKESGTVTLRTTDGKKITYKANDKEAYAKYAPVNQVTNKDGTVVFTNKDGSITYKSKKRTQAITKMEDTDDARTLISKANTQMENVYADYANKMKSLANEARKEMMTTGKIPYNATARGVYQDEVYSLQNKIKESELNKPKERQAQLQANSRIKAILMENKDMTKEDIKKLKQRELSKARDEVGAKRVNIKVTDREWEAIQAGAISETMLKQILNNADMDVIKQKAMPRNSTELTAAKQTRITSMRNSGLTISQIADALGVSTSTVSNYLKGKE